MQIRPSIADGVEDVENLSLGIIRIGSHGGSRLASSIMTLKQAADIAGKSESTMRSWAEVH
jgi:hypothetical protein